MEDGARDCCQHLLVGHLHPQVLSSVTWQAIDWQSVEASKSVVVPEGGHAAVPDRRA